MKKYVITGVFIIVIAGAFLFNWSNQSNNGSILSNASNDVLSVSKTTVSLKASLFSTLYDSSLRIKNSVEKDSGPIYSQYMLSSKNDQDDSQVAVTIADLEGNISDSSPARFRLLNTEQYKESNVSFSPVDSLVFIKNSELSYEIAVIWPNNNYYTAVVGSGTSANKQNIDELVSDIVSNWMWKE